MKKIFLLAVLAMGASISYGQVTDPNIREMFKDEFVKSCMQSIEEEYDQTDPTYKAMKEYCDCSADKVLDKFTGPEIAAFTTKTEEELTTMIMPVIKLCEEKLQKDLGY